MLSLSILFTIVALISTLVVAAHSTSLPASFSWIDRGFTLKPPNSFECGGGQMAWVLANQISGVAIAQNKTQKAIELSAAQLVECDVEYQCDSGTFSSTISNLITNSAGFIATNESYPWTNNIANGNPGACKTTGWKIGAKVSGYRHLPNSEKAMQEYIYTHGPVTVAVDPFKWICGGYPVVFGSRCVFSDSYEHALLVLGWRQRTVTIPETNETKTIPVWITMNTFGDQWADNGFIDLEMFVNCSGIAYRGFGIDVDF